jgi:hypothetical protein
MLDPIQYEFRFFQYTLADPEPEPKLRYSGSGSSQMFQLLAAPSPAVLWWCIHSLLCSLNVPTHTFHPMYVTTPVHFVHYIIVTNPHIVLEFIVHPGNGGGGLGWTNSASTCYVTHRPMYFLSTLGRNVTTLWYRKRYAMQLYIS